MASEGCRVGIAFSPQGSKRLAYIVLSALLSSYPFFNSRSKVACAITSFPISEAPD